MIVVVKRQGPWINISFGESMGKMQGGYLVRDPEIVGCTVMMLLGEYGKHSWKRLDLRTVEDFGTATIGEKIIEVHSQNLIIDGLPVDKWIYDAICKNRGGLGTLLKCGCHNAPLWVGDGPSKQNE
jgi:hypothetical protein